MTRILKDEYKKYTRLSDEKDRWQRQLKARRSLFGESGIWKPKAVETACGSWTPVEYDIG